MTKTVRDLNLKPFDVLIPDLKAVDPITVRDNEINYSDYLYCNSCDSEVGDDGCDECRDDEALERFVEVEVPVIRYRPDRASTYNSWHTFKSYLTPDNSLECFGDIKWKLFRPTHPNAECKNFRKVEPNET